MFEFTLLRRAGVVVAAGLLLSLCFRSAHAASTLTWNGTPGAAWTTSSTNWSTGVATPWDTGNGPSDIAYFSSGTAAIGSIVNANGLILAGTSNTISGGTLNLLGSPTPSISTSAASTISAVISGSNGLALNGISTLTLGGSNTYTGVTSVSSGTVTVTGNDAAAYGGWSILNSNNTSTQTVNFNAGSSIAVASTATFQLGAVGGSGAAATLNVLGSVSNSGALNVQRAAVFNVNNGGLWTQTGPMEIATPSGGVSSNMTIATGGSLTYNNASTSLIQISPANNAAGSATLTVSGLFTTNQGFVDLVAGTGSGSANINLVGGTLLLTANIPALTATNGSAFNFTLGTGGGTINTGGFATTMNGVMSGAGGLTVAGTGGMLTLNASNTYTGTTVISGGTLVAGTLGALPTNGALSFTNNSGTASVNIGSIAQTLSNLSFPGTVAGNEVVTIIGSAGSSITVSPSVLTLSPTTTTTLLNLTLSMPGVGALTYSNSTGTVTASAADASTINNVSVTLPSGTNSITAATLNVGSIAGPGNAPNSSSVYLGSSSTLAVNSINVGTGSRAEGTLTFAPGLTNPSLTINGAAGPGSTTNLVLGKHDSFNVNNFANDLLDTTAGTLNAQFGTIVIGEEIPTSEASGTRGFTNTATFNMGAGSMSATSMTLGMIQNVTGTSAGLYQLSYTSAFTMVGGTADIGTLTILSNSYTAGLTGTNTLNVQVTVGSGALLDANTIAEGTNATPSAGTFTTTSQLNLNGGTLGNYTSNLSMSGATLALTTLANGLSIAPSQSGTISSLISGTGALNIVGAGLLSLNASNSFTGGVTLSSGTLVAGNAAALGSGTLAMNGGTLQTTIAGGNSTPAISNAILVNPVAGSTFNAPSGNNLVLGGNLTGSGAVTKTGANSVYLTGSNAGFSGTYINAQSNTFFGSANAGSPAASWVINAGSLANSLSGPQTISLGELSGGGGSLGNNVAGSVVTYSVGALGVSSTYSGAIVDTLGPGGTAAVTKTGSATLTLAGSSNYSGATIVSSGALLLGGGSLNASGAISVANSATFGGLGSAGSATIAAGGALQAGYTGAGSLNLSGLSFSGSGGISIGSLANYSSNAAITVSGNNALSTSGANSIVITIGSLSGTSTGVAYELIGFSGAIQGSSSSAFQVAALPNRATGALSIVGNDLDVTLKGSDFLHWTGAVSPTWDTSTQGNSQNWILNSNSAPTSFINGTPAAGDTVVFDNTAGTNTSVSLSTTLYPTAVTVSSSNNYTFSGPGSLAGLTGLTVVGPGSLTLGNSGGNTYTGGTAIQGGAIILGVNNALPTTGVVTFGSTGSSGILDLAGNNQTIGGIAIVAGATAASQVITSSVGSATLTFNGGSSVFSGSIQDTALTSGGTLSLTVGSGTLNASSGATNYYGATTVSSGELLVGDLPNTSSITVAGGYLSIAGSVNSAAPLAVASGGSASIADSNLSIASVSNSGGLSFTGTSGAITLGDLNGTGTTSFAAAANFPNLSAGLVTIAGSASIGTASGGKAILNGPTASIGVLTDSNIVLGAGTDLLLSSGTQTIGTISGPGGITMSGSGMLSLGGVNTYTSFTTVNGGGILQLAGGSALGSPSAALTVDSGTLDLAGYNVSVGTLSGIAGTITSSTTPATLTTTSTANTSFGGSITGPLSFVDNNNGTLLLFGVSTYSGSTAIGSGTLALVGSGELPATTINFGLPGSQAGGNGLLNLGSANQAATGLTVANSFTGSVTGSGGLTVSGGGDFRIGGTSGSNAQTLNMSGLNAFVFSGSANTFDVGGQYTGSTSTSFAKGTVWLAASNTITANLFGAASTNGDSQTSGNTSTGTIYLGQANTINANTFELAYTLARSNPTGTLEFAPNSVNPTLTINGTNGSSRAKITVGAITGSAYPSYSNGTIDLVSGVSGTSTLDALVSQLLVGYNSYTSSGGSANGTFAMGGGLLDATTIILGDEPVVDTIAGSENGVFSLSGGTVVVNTLTLGNLLPGSTAAVSVSGTFNLNSGELSAQLIQSGSGSGTRVFNWTGGTIANYNETFNSVNTVAGLTASIPTISMTSSAAHVFWIDADQTGNIYSSIGETGSDSTSLTKAGPGLLALSGTNTFSGGLYVSSGEVELNGASSLLAGTALTIGSDAGPGAIFSPPAASLSIAAPQNLAPVPEPGTIVLLAIAAVAGLGIWRRRKRV